MWLHIIIVLQALGFTINRAAHKCIALCLALPWLGLRLDSLAMTVSLPQDKVAKALALVRTVRSSATVTRKQLDSVFGYLSWASAVVYGGRAFLHSLRRLRYRSAGDTLTAQQHVNVSAGLRADMGWFDVHLERLNGDPTMAIIQYDRVPPTVT